MAMYCTRKTELAEGHLMHYRLHKTPASALFLSFICVSFCLSVSICMRGCTSMYDVCMYVSVCVYVFLVFFQSFHLLPRTRRSLMEGERDQHKSDVEISEENVSLFSRPCAGCDELFILCIIHALTKVPPAYDELTQ